MNISSASSAQSTLPQNCYDYTQEHIRQLIAVVRLRHMSVPDSFYTATVDSLQKCYNGIGPDRWSGKFRQLITRILEWLEAPALIHDWEYSQPNKSFRHFTVSNIRLCINAWKDGRFRFGLAAALLCQLFGWQGYNQSKENGVCMKKLCSFFPVAILLTCMLTACFSATQNTIREYNADGKLTRETITTESVIKTVVGSTKDKTLVIWDNSWLAYVSASTSTVEDPTPILKMGVGRSDKGIVSLYQKHDVSVAPDIIKAARSGEISLSSTGIGAASAKENGEK